MSRVPCRMSTCLPMMNSSSHPRSVLLKCQEEGWDHQALLIHLLSLFHRYEKVSNTCRPTAPAFIQPCEARYPPDRPPSHHRWVWRPRRIRDIGNGSLPGAIGLVQQLPRLLLAEEAALPGR